MSGGRVIEAQLRAPGVSVQVFREDYPTPVEGMIHEPALTVALQRQPPQHYSNGRYCISGASRHFDAIGRVLIVPAEVPLQVRASGGHVRAVRCSFSPERLAALTGRSGAIEPGALKSCLDVREPRIAGLLSRLGEEAMAPGLASDVLTDALGLSLMVEFARYMDRVHAPARPARGGLSQRQYRMITESIHERQNVTLEDLATLAGISRRHLSRAFKQSSGQTIHEYVEQIRLEKAMALLAETDLMMKDIAFRLGFSSACSFSVAFRRAAGETPQGFRARTRRPTAH